MACFSSEKLIQFLALTLGGLFPTETPGDPTPFPALFWYGYTHVIHLDTHNKYVFLRKPLHV